MSATVADVLRGDARWCVVEGDSVEVLRSLPAGCINALVTDPPSGIAFMGAEWDKHKGGRAQWIAWLAGVLASSRAAMVDGSRAFVWSLPRTSHWTGCAVEDAGFAIETTVQHLFATGWPKGASQLKPAAETWWLARAGRSTGLNIDACRVPGSRPAVFGGAKGAAQAQFGAGTVFGNSGKYLSEPHSAGRYPPNVVLSHHALCAGDVDGVGCVEGCAVAELAAQSGGSVSGGKRGGETRADAMPDGWHGRKVREHTTHGDTGTAARFYPQFPADDPGAPYNAPLFHYEAKPSTAEKEAGVTVDARKVILYGELGQGPLPQQTPRAPRDARNDHPTVKPVALMRWLLRLITRPGDVVLDPFGGSGTTGVAALLEGRRVILVEREARFASISRARCEHARPSAETVSRMVAAPIAAPAADFGPLFGGAR